MIIYPSESFASDQTLSEKKLNTYFEFQKQQSNVAASIFSEDGVQVFVSENGDTQQYAYCVLPLIEYLCFEIFKAGNNAFNLKMLITHWKEYVQAARSHTSLFAEHCHWQKFAMQMTQEQQDLYDDLKSLLLNDELRELDDIIRACCGAEVNKDSNKPSELQIASKLAHSASELKNKEAILQEYKNCEIEKAALEALVSEKQANETQLEEQKRQLEDKFTKLIEEKDSYISSLKKESELSLLQLLKLQEELEALFVLKEAREDQIENLKAELANTDIDDSSSLKSIQAENELMLLQILQLQEELEFYFMEANNKSREENIVSSTREETRGDSVVNCPLENNNTLGLINRLIRAQGRE